MRTITAVYKGNRQIELQQDIDLPSDTTVAVILPAKGEDRLIQQNLQKASEAGFSKLWDNEEDDIWNEYL